jgi:hypothetical protein
MDEVSPVHTVQVGSGIYALVKAFPDWHFVSLSTQIGYEFYYTGG